MIILQIGSSNFIQGGEFSSSGVIEVTNMRSNWRKVDYLRILGIATILVGTAEGMSYGIKAGINIANLHGTGSTYSRIGFCGGCFAILKLTDVFVVQPEALYTQKGTKWGRALMLPGTLQVVSKLNYFEMPILLKMILPDKGNVKPHLFVGPYFGLNVSAKDRIEVNGEIREEDIENAQGTEFGMVFGGGLDFILRTGRIVFDGRYTVGLTTTLEESIETRNRVISIMLGYSF